MSRKRQFSQCKSTKVRDGRYPSIWGLPTDYAESHDEEERRGSLRHRPIGQPHDQKTALMSG
ncbi:MAG TPA: hypothetical protein VFV38_10145 [Ktedonobacteraceae bacterium]|nr:hypothetical protein [Ktedonobacteraceae bacterium]